MKRVLEFLRRSTHGIPLPIEWMLEVTNRCDLACPMCLRDKARFVQRDMDPHFAKHLLDDARSRPSAIWPYGFGEPLLYPALPEIIGYAKEKQILVSLSTNGTHLSEDVGHKLLDSRLDYLIVAFDGATPETYAKYRKGARFHQVKANVERFIASKLARGSSLHLTLQMILMKDTAQEIARFKRLWNVPGVDCVRVREDLSSSGVSPKPPIKHRPCFFLWRGPLFVQAAGTVIPCPYYHGSEAFGDLRRESPMQAWNSPKMEALRRAHISGDLSQFPICAKCPRYQPHTIVAAAGFFVGTRGIRRYLPVAERIQHRLGRKFFE
jgi:MoaA/NifB/PqqE/SkfB family radical SAM enzyme